MAEVILQVLICVVIADFITGLAHWFEQTYGVPSWPLIGNSVVLPNIDHHINPSRIVSSNLFTRCWNMWLLAGLVLSSAWIVGVMSWKLTLVAVIASFGNEVHSWAHGRAPRWARVAQEMGILLSPRQHAEHHKPPYETNFCTLTCWTNPILDSLGFWRAIEWTLKFAGIKPKRMSAERSGV